MNQLQKIVYPLIPSQEGKLSSPPREGCRGGLERPRKLVFRAFKVKHLRSFVLSIVFFALALLWSVQPAQAQTPYDQLKQKFENGQVFEANFTHRYIDSYTQDTVKNSGQIWVGKEQYKVESPSQRVAIDGKLSRVYDGQRNRLIISEYVPEEDDFAPSRILNGIDSTYTINQQQKKGSRHIITLSSADPFALFRQVRITLNEELVPMEIFVKDPADNLITTTFTGGAFKEKRNNIFELQYPADAEIIDMRN